MIQFALVAFAQLATANPALQIAVESISTDEWTVSQLETTFELTGNGLQGEVRIARVALRDSAQTFDNVSVRCTSVQLTTRTVACDKAVLTATLPGLGRQSTPGSFVYDRLSGDTRIELDRLAVANSAAQLTIVASESGIDARFSGEQLQLAGLLDIASQFSDAFDEYAASGIGRISGRLIGSAGSNLQLILSAELSETAFANNAGTLAAEGVDALLDLDLKLHDEISTFNIEINSSKGEVYLEPVYANLSEHALQLQAERIVTADFATFEVGYFQLQQETQVDVSGTTQFTLQDDDELPLHLTAQLELSNTSVSSVYTNLVKIQFAGTLFGNLETDGRMSGSVNIADDSLVSAKLRLDDVILDDNQGRFAIYGLNGLIDWHTDAQASTAKSQLQWDSGTAYNIAFGGAAVGLQLGGNSVELLAPLRLPTMGGALLINQLELKNYGGENATGTLDAELEPIQLGQLTGAFGWPAFSGALSGRLPLLQLAENTVTVGGTLSARAFDGTIEVSKLRVEQPFGKVPRMQADIRLRDLDLQRVTEAFSFGLIQGRLSGDVSGLRMDNWRPVAMDMHFYTPPDDKTQHRISQRAVENLASVGGSGAAAVLSTGFLQFFEVFAYDQIGLRCVLLDGTCRMSGAGPAKAGPQGTGYYIVKGRGVPRIDVVGFRNNVSWQSLVRQLAAITRSDAPTIK